MRQHRFSREWAKRRSGSVLIMVMITAALLVLMVGASVRSAYTQARLADRSFMHQQAMAMAEAGVERAILELNNNPANKTITESVSDVGQFTVTISGTGGANPVIDSYGYVPSRASAEITRRVRVAVEANQTPSPFEWGIFAYGDMAFHSGFHMGSMKSSDTVDPPQSWKHLDTHGNIGGLGDVEFGTGKGGGGKSCKVQGSVQVDGEVTKSSVAVSGTNTDGAANELIENSTPESPPDFPTEDLEAAKASNLNLTGIAYTTVNGQPITDKKGNILSAYDSTTNKLSADVNNAVITMDPGVYYFSGIDIEGNNVEIKPSSDGEILIYLEGDFELGGNHTVINEDNEPNDFRVYQASGDLEWANAGRLNMAVFAPFTDMVINNSAHFFGAIVGRDITLAGGGGHFVYDEDLGSPSGSSSGGVVALSWVEIAP